MGVPKWLLGAAWHSFFGSRKHVGNDATCKVLSETALWRFSKKNKAQLLKILDVTVSELVTIECEKTISFPSVFA